MAPTTAPMPEWLIGRLVCPLCRVALAFDRGPDGDGILRHRVAAPCDEAYPVISGIPRMLLASHRRASWRAHRAWFGRDPERRALADRWAMSMEEHGRSERVVRGFDDEWRRFDVVDSGDERIGFTQYFDLVPPEALGEERVVLDAGCGAGRWAHQVSARGPRVIAVDLGESIEIAARNTAASGRVACVQADLHFLPLATGSVDWAYSLGVLHHVEDPQQALRNVAMAVADRGAVLLYLYYALDSRGVTYRALFAAVDAIRRMTSRLPRPALVAFAAAVALFVYWPLARLAAIAARFGARRLADALPLNYYRDRSLRIMRNDSVDRFGTALERRYSKGAFASLTAAAGLAAPIFSARPPYWHAVAAVSPRG